jgi:hypothetical protein
MNNTNDYKCPHCKEVLSSLYCNEQYSESFDFDIATGDLDSLDGSYQCISSIYECPLCNEQITGDDLPKNAIEF